MTTSSPVVVCTPLIRAWICHCGAHLCRMTSFLFWVSFVFVFRRKRHSHYSCLFVCSHARPPPCRAHSSAQIVCTHRPSRAMNLFVPYRLRYWSKFVMQIVDLFGLRCAVCTQSHIEVMCRVLGSDYFRTANGHINHIPDTHSTRTPVLVVRIRPGFYTFSSNEMAMEHLFLLLAMQTENGDDWFWNRRNIKSVRIETFFGCRECWSYQMADQSTSEKKKPSIIEIWTSVMCLLLPASSSPSSSSRSSSTIAINHSLWIQMNWIDVANDNSHTECGVVGPVALAFFGPMAKYDDAHIRGIWLPM